jgi:hypothetical protein
LNGDKLALVAVAALAAASVARRRGSLATDEQIDLESLLGWYSDTPWGKIVDSHPHLINRLHNLDLGSGWWVNKSGFGRPFAHAGPQGTQWTVRTFAIQDVPYESLPIQISNGEGEVFRVYARLVYKTLAGKKYVFNGDLAHDTQAWIDLVRPWTQAIDDGKLGTMLDRHGALELGQDPDQINELTP